LRKYTEDRRHESKNKEELNIMLIIKENTKTHAKLEGILNEHVEESRSNRLHMLQVIR